MRRRVFLDIGAHVGETLGVVMQPRWHFEAIYSFEPAPACWPALEQLADSRVTICRFGLSNENAQALLYNAGEIGASTSADKDPKRVGASLCEFVDSAAWFRVNVRDDDEVFAKVNIEGAEPEVIAALDEAGMLGQIAHLLIHFDVRKVPSRAHLERDIRDRLDASGIDYIEAEKLFHGDVRRGTRNWLVWCSLSRWSRKPYELLRRAEGRTRIALYPIKQRITSRAQSLRG